MIWRTLATDTFDIALPVNQSFDVWATIIRGKFQTVYRDIIERVKSSGAMGMFAGADAASSSNSCRRISSSQPKTISRLRMFTHRYPVR